MKKFTKVLSIVLLVAMCVSMFTISSFADAPNHRCAKYATDVKAAKGVAYVAPTCETDGNCTYYICQHPDCGDIFTDASCEAEYEITLADTVLKATGHNKQLITGTPATCTAAGVADAYWCSECGLWWDEAGNEITDRTTAALDHSYGEWTVQTEATVSTDGLEVRTCTRSGCGVQDTRVIPKLTARPFSVSGTTPAEFDKNSSYTYYIDLPEVYGLKQIKIGGTSIYEDAYKYTASTGKIVIYGGEIASLVGTEPSVEIVFIANDGSEAGGFTLNNATTVDTLSVDGFKQKGFIKGSTESVYITTNDPNPNNVKLFSARTGKYVEITDFDFDALGGGVYTYTFTKAFLDTLEAGTYYARCFWGDGKYEPAGTLNISLSEATSTDILKFTNSTISESEFKYVSGKEGPRLYSPMFRDSELLQVSTDGYSWKNVSVYDYYVEQSNGKDTSYAWIKTSYLDKLPASSNVYFRVIVPASVAGLSEDARTDWVKITTGHTLAAVDTNKHVINSSKNLKFVCSDVISEVYVGGQNLAKTDPDAFKVSADGKYVTLYADFLNDRTAGSTYTLSVLTKSGEKLSTTFQILTTAQASASPRTADDSNIALWSAFLLMSGAAVVAVLPRLKKED